MMQRDDLVRESLGKAWHDVCRYSRTVLSFDPRSLAAFRIGAAVMLLLDLAVRATSLEAHYTDAGLFPRSVLFTFYSKITPWSLHAAVGDSASEACLFIVAAIFAGMLLVGYKTRLATVVSWILLVSLQARNVMVEIGSDIVLRDLLLWSIALPLGACWSVDAKLRGTKREPVLSVAGLGFLVQVLVIYVFAAALKTGPAWRITHDAAYYALSIEQHSTELGNYLRRFPELLRLGTVATLALEAFGPLLFLIPLTSARLIAVGVFMMMHIGLGLCLDLSLFSPTCVVMLTAFLPRAFWDWLAGAKAGPSFSKRSSTEAAPGPFSLLGQGIGIALVILTLALNFASLPKSAVKIPPLLDDVASILRLNQKWTMFAPTPTTDDGWYVIPGTLRDGRKVDVWRQTFGAVAWQKPEHIAAMYADGRWRKIMMTIHRDEYADLRPGVTAYLCRQWNEAHPAAEQLASFDLYFILKPSTPPGTEPVHSRRKILTQSCQPSTPQSARVAQGTDLKTHPKF